ncbi:MAG: peroxiredoxin [Pseudomonadota bacterium]
MIAVGDKLPEASFKTLTADGPIDRTADDLFVGKKVALFAVPGAFTPTCHINHLPGFLTHLDAFKEKGVDMVACVAVNDMFVLDHWAKATGAHGKIEMLSDGNGTFTKDIGLELDASAFGLGMRSQRYAMFVDDGVVKVLNVEDAPGQADVSSAETLLEAI